MGRIKDRGSEGDNSVDEVKSKSKCLFTMVSLIKNSPFYRGVEYSSCKV